MKVNKNFVFLTKVQESKRLLKFNRFKYNLPDELFDLYEL